MTDLDTSPDGRRPDTVSSVEVDVTTQEPSGSQTETTNWIIGGRLIRLAFTISRNSPNELTITLRAQSAGHRNRETAVLGIEILLEPLTIRVGFRSD